MGKNLINVALFGLGRIGLMHANNLINNKSNFLVDRTSEILINDKTVGIYNKNVINLLNKINLQNE